MPPLRIPLSRPPEIVVIENLPALVQDDDEPTWPGRALPRDARRIFPPPWAGGRRPPWAAVLPEPEPVATTQARTAFQPQAVPSDILEEDLFELDPDPVEPPEGMVWVPPRQIRFGEKTFEVEGHLLDRFLVTRRDWEVFAHQTGARTPEGWRGGRPPAGTEEQPMTDVSLADALAYAHWRGARLPTVAEWLAAAAGLTWFPPSPERCGALCHCPRAGHHTAPAPVGAHPDSDSIDGCSDLLGNVWEWVAPDDRLPPPDPDHAWALGGSFKHACPTQPSRWGSRVPQTMIHRGKTWPHLGFRCAGSVR